MDYIINAYKALRKLHKYYISIKHSMIIYPENDTKNNNWMKYSNYNRYKVKF